MTTKTIDELQAHYVHHALEAYYLEKDTDLAYCGGRLAMINYHHLQAERATLDLRAQGAEPIADVHSIEAYKLLIKQREAS